jgi:hypothetical protein
MKTKIDDPDYWQSYGVIVYDCVLGDPPYGRLQDETLYNLRVQAYPDILNERGEKIGRVG